MYLPAPSAARPAPAREQRRLEHGERRAGEKAKRGGNDDDELVPPQDPQGPAQVQRLAHSSGLRVDSPLCPRIHRDGPSDSAHDTADRVKAGSGAVPASRNSSRVLRLSPGAERPRPSSVTAGTRRPRPREYQPRIGSALASVQAPPQRARQFQPRRPGRGRARPAQDRAGPVELRPHVGAEVEGEADVVAAADLVDDVDAARGPVQPDRATVPGGRPERRCSRRAPRSSSATSPRSATSISRPFACRSQRKGPPSPDWLCPPSSTVLCAIVERK